MFDKLDFHVNLAQPNVHFFVSLVKNNISLYWGTANT